MLDSLAGTGLARDRGCPGGLQTPKQYISETNVHWDFGDKIRGVFAPLRNFVEELLGPNRQLSLKSYPVAISLCPSCDDLDAEPCGYQGAHATMPAAAALNAIGPSFAPSGQQTRTCGALGRCSRGAVARIRPAVQLCARHSQVGLRARAAHSRHPSRAVPQLLHRGPHRPRQEHAQRPAAGVDGDHFAQ